MTIKATSRPDPLPRGTMTGSRQQVYQQRHTAKVNRRCACGALIKPESKLCADCSRQRHGGRKSGTKTIETESDYLNGLLYNGMLAEWVRGQLCLPETMCGVYGTAGGCAHCEYEIPAHCPNPGVEYDEWVECDECMLPCRCTGTEEETL